ncbi:Eukaryotic translation initiation factor 1A [Penicillium ucsense]|uniref:Eukaryotic translation initiation factor 1A n=1 Tax=Penicillium ucsense TaxID=2839758 RepID=A0A8J8WND7_9EURO|nr:Eukaryotic translation initiation factor 1A [Penicillium ucsense]KAF7739454.1 Eukaryotic translation initiation factor 1A [Penicillium ucsense]
MAPPRRKVLATAEGTLFPPDELSSTQQIVRAVKATGNNIYLIEQADKTQMLVELPAKFRSTFWIKRGSYVVIDTESQEERDNKIKGEIINIVRDEKTWRKAPFWPKEFAKQPAAAVDSDSDEEESRAGKMPSSDESDA